MIDQFKLIYYYYEFYYYCGRVRVCAGMCVYLRVCKGVCGYAQGCAVWAGVNRCAQVCTGVRRCVLKCVDVCECVLGMNSQNVYWRIESLHQRTLIRILYEFFFQGLAIHSGGIPRDAPGIQRASKNY